MTTARYSNPDHACPICGGHSRLPHGKGIRCWGMDGTDGYAHCTNERFAGQLVPHIGQQGGISYAHRLEGPCHCGVVHSPKRNGAEDRTPTPFHPQEYAMQPQRSSNANSTATPKLVATYEYHHADGRPAFRVMRVEPGRDGRNKEFYQRVPDGNGGWKKGLKDADAATKALIYRLPAVLAAVAKHETIYLVEGEKDADNLVAKGLCATTTWGGAHRTPPAKLAVWIYGARVVLVRDKDEPGRAHAERLKALLDPVCDVKLVEAKTGKDASDHLAAGHTIDELVPVAGRPPTPLEEALAASSLQRFAGPPPEREWLVTDLIPANDTGLLVAAGGVGKGHMTFQVGIALATGLRFGPFEVPRSAGVLYLSWEDDANELHRRYRAALHAFWPGGVPAEEEERLRRYFHVVDLVGLDVSLGPELANALAERLRAIPDCKLIIVDPLSLSLPPMEHALNTQEGAAQAHRLLNQIRRQTGCGLIAAHHISKQAKRGKQELESTAATGSLQLVDLARYTIHLRELDEEDVAVRHLDFGHSYLELINPKSNRGPRMKESAVWRRGQEGALIYVGQPTRKVVDEQAALEALQELRLATAAQWRTECGLSKHRFHTARTILLNQKLVRRVIQQRGGNTQKPDLYECSSS
jgi:AAA domain